jgi:hypothetical protein
MSASFKDLRVWQEAMKFAVEVYRTTAQFPRHELYGLSNQLRRAAVSIPSNIAEGKGIARIVNLGITCFTQEVPCWKYKRK